MRQQLLRGERPKQCDVCFRKEDLGAISMRESSVGNLDVRSRLISFGKEDSVPPPSHLQLRLSGLCNLACVMCNSSFSSLWEKELSKMRPNQEWMETYHPVSKKGERSVDSIIDYVLRISDQLQGIYFTGGETSTCPHVKKILSQLIDLGRTDIKISVVSNLSSLSDDFYSLLDRFQQVRLHCSVDAYGSANEYIRWPMRWEKFDSNLRSIVSSKHYDIALDIAYQNLSLFSLFDLLEHYSDIKLDYFLQMVDIPPILSPHNLPQGVAERWLAAARSNRHSHILEPIINTLSSHSHETHIPVNQYLDPIDLKRGTDWKLTFPHMIV